MSCKGYAPVLWLECRGDSRLRYAYAGFSLLCLLSILLLPWPWWGKLPVLGFLVVLLLRCWQGRCELGGPGIRLHWDEDGQWWCHPAGQAMRLEREQLLSPWLIVLRLRPFDGLGRPLAVLFTPHTLGEENFRKLTLRLRQPERDGQQTLG